MVKRMAVLGEIDLSLADFNLLKRLGEERCLGAKS
jgi:hypothetical protein